MTDMSPREAADQLDRAQFTETLMERREEIIALQRHARATTGGDRGRELAEIASVLDGVVRGLGGEFTPDGGRRRTLTDAARFAVSPPAQGEAERAGVWALIASWERDAAEHTRQHPDDGPPALPMASAIRELRDALTPDPPAQGEAGTEGEDADGDLLVAAESALRTLAKKCLAVKPTLSEPFPDAPDVTPWDRFIEQPCREAYDLAVHIRRRLAVTTPSPRAAEAGSWTALRSKLDEWLAEPGISQDRRTVLVQVHEWIDSRRAARTVPTAPLPSRVPVCQGFGKTTADCPGAFGYCSPCPVHPDRVPPAPAGPAQAEGGGGDQ